MKKPIRVLVVDDSALVRTVLTRGLDMDPDIEVVGSASDPYIARDRIIELNPDVLTLDVEMPRMDGVEFLRKLMPQHPMPVLMVSSLTERGKQITMDALNAGAVDFVAKPTVDLQRGLSKMLGELRRKVKAVATANVSHWKNKKPIQRPKIAAKALAESTDKVLAIGASTGGTRAISELVQSFPIDMLGTVIVQHMPPGFTSIFAKDLDRASLVKVQEASHGDRILPGLVLIAPGDKHLKVVRSGGNYHVEIFESEKVNGHRPSVDVLFQSVAEDVAKNSIGVILTGMGGDGAKGLLSMKEAGARTFGQDEKTSVVYGMPKVAYDLGAVEVQLPLELITSRIIQLLSKAS